MGQDLKAALPAGVPVYDIEYYSDEVIRAPWHHYAAMRDLGEVIFIPSLGNYAVTRYAECRQVLENWRVFSSAQGLSGDKIGCDFFVGASNITNDPPLHDQIRAVMQRPLIPKALKSFRGVIEHEAAGLIERLVERREFDGMADLASYLPVTLVKDLVGLPDEGRENMLGWAAGAFDITGIQNERGRKGVETVSAMQKWVLANVTADKAVPGSLTGRVRDMIDNGEIPEDWFLRIMNDYITPALDTTISATGHLIYHLGKNPDQWELLKQDPTLIAGAINEALRMNAPIRSFSRTTTCDYEIAGVLLPKDARVMVIYASANRDNRKYPDPDTFNIRRPNSDHLGFGYGIHSCVGKHLAKLEIQVLIEELVKHVDRIEVGEPTMALNNTIHAYATLPVTFTGFSG
jgi:cytochrome P450